jgi:signal peptidase
MAGGPGSGAQRRDSRRGGRRGEPEPEEEEEEDSKQAKRAEWKSTGMGLLRDVSIAVIIMLILIGSMWIYTGNWPPMVVVESESMMHDEDSEVGVIDTGDLVLVKKVDGRGDITTYYEGKKDDYKTYDDYGDVIIYKKDGIGPDEAADLGLESAKYTPVIHRVLLWLEFDKDATDSDPRGIGHFNIPELNLFDITGQRVIDENFPAYAKGDKNAPLILDLDQIYERMRHNPHSGYITKGDHNPVSNPNGLASIDQYQTSEPVEVDWVIGKAKGELPWFGLIKLYVSGSLDDPPPRSVNMLIFTIALLIILPIIIDVAYSLYVNKRKSDKGEDKEEEEEEPTDRRGRGRGGGPGFDGQRGPGPPDRPDRPDISRRPPPGQLPRRR